MSQRFIAIVKKNVPTLISHQSGNRFKVCLILLVYLNEVDEIIVLVVRTDGGEELFERSLLSGGELPGCHVKS